mmetsp:Transcript_5700/g.22529  ORF Transcript_5700/g.22529 Transcript_5700/m.22529 type:complete len:223 (-) Transcript_5700:450-1118(-)
MCTTIADNAGPAAATARPLGSVLALASPGEDGNDVPRSRCDDLPGMLDRTALEEHGAAYVARVDRPAERREVRAATGVRRRGVERQRGANLRLIAVPWQAAALGTVVAHNEGVVDAQPRRRHALHRVGEQRRQCGCERTCPCLAEHRQRLGNFGEGHIRGGHAIVPRGSPAAPRLGGGFGGADDRRALLRRQERRRDHYAVQRREAVRRTGVGEALGQRPKG